MRSPSALNPMPKKIPLYLILTLQFIIQVLGIVGLVGYLSYRSGYRAVEEIAHRLMAETGDRIVDNFNHYLKIPFRINDSNISALESGTIKPQDLDQLHRYLILTKQKYPEVSSLLWGSPQGDFLFAHQVTSTEVRSNPLVLSSNESALEAGRSDPQDPTRLHSYRVTPTGELGEDVQTLENVAVQERPWYRQGVTSGKPSWSQPFQLGVSNQLTINASAPVYDQQQNLLGVFSVNITLERLDEFLKTLSISEHSEIFIIERNGLLIANSAGEASFKVSLPTTQGNNIPGTGKFQRRSILESDRPLLRETAEVLQQKLGNFADIDSPQDLSITLTDPELTQQLGRTYYLRVIPYQDTYGLDWLIVTVVPASDFMTEIYGNVRRTALLCGLALIVSMSSSLWLSRRMTRSLSHLTTASQTFMTENTIKKFNPPASLKLKPFLNLFKP